MGGGRSPRRSSGEADGTVPAPGVANGDPLSSHRLEEFPILLLVFFHKAFRAELAQLRRLAESSHRLGDAAELRERFVFLKLAYKYHCTAEDEVVFLALDSQVDNIACTYSLEHKSIDELFDSLFRLLEASLKNGGDDEAEVDPSSHSFREIIFSVGTIQATICKHMLKEEQQVFPLLMERLSRKEQASLVWQFLCSVPIGLLEDVLPWMISFLSQEERTDVISCVRDVVVPKEEPLQELVDSWFRKKTRALSGIESSNTETNRSLLSCLTAWHGAVRKDFEATFQEFRKLRSSTSVSSLQSVVVHLKFLADVLAFYSDVLDRHYYPILTGISRLSPVDRFKYKRRIESLQRFLRSNEKLDRPDSRIIHKLRQELESWATDTSQFFSFQETEVFDWIMKNCSHKVQQQLIYKTVRTLPLGLLKCVVTWFSAHLTAEESVSILRATNREEDYLWDKSFTTVLHQWFRVAFTGKTPIDKFRRDLQKADVAYSGGSSQHVLGFPSFPGEDRDFILGSDGEMPIDIVYYFHKALKKDLEKLVVGSCRFTEDPGMYEDFREQFRLVRLLYRVHSNAEDEVAFPALEAKGKGANISCSYTIDHKLEVEHFDGISSMLDKMSWVKDRSVHHSLGVKLQDMCRSMKKVLMDHIRHEEIEIWPLFRDCFSSEEQEKIVGSMLGRTTAEVLQEMIPWLTKSLSDEGHRAMMGLWKRVTRNTMFGEWLREWWDPDSCNVFDRTEQNVLPSTSFQTMSDPLDIISTYLSKDILEEHERSPTSICDAKLDIDYIGDETKDSKRAEKGSDDEPPSLTSTEEEDISSASQEELESAIRRVSRDPSLDPPKKSYIMQNLLMSRWIITHRKPYTVSGEAEEIPGTCPSYRDAAELTFGCKHYKRNCKLLADCCNRLFSCRRCHDEAADHTLDRKSIDKMMCMKCLAIQPIGPTCATASCDGLSMGRYFCRICKIYDDEREIYHCPYCNLCRVGKGLGIDYFHCMNCNACMSRSLTYHICREKCFEDNCPICHEYIFTSSNPVKGLPCGHLMHSTCFQEYTCSHYTCPICSKSLGDMQVYFQMLDTLLSEEKMPDEYSGQTQVILCNDCEKRGAAPFHWLYHKCAYCGSYNTRLL